MWGDLSSSSTEQESSQRHLTPNKERRNSTFSSHEGLVMKTSLYFETSSFQPQTFNRSCHEPCATSNLNKRKGMNGTQLYPRGVLSRTQFLDSRTPTMCLLGFSMVIPLPCHSVLSFRQRPESEEVSLSYLSLSLPNQPTKSP